MHEHLAVDMNAEETGEKVRALARLSKYFQRAGYDVWIGDEAEVVHDPAPREPMGSAQALGVYLREATARYVNDFSDANLAIYVQQVYYPAPLHRWQSLGPLRAFAARLRAEGVRAHAEEDGRVVLVPMASNRAQRRRDAAWVAAGPCVLALRTAWVGSELRPVAMVRGWKGDWADLARRYDLDAAVRAARRALKGARPFTTATPESVIVLAVDRARTPPVPPRWEPPDMARAMEEIPW